MPLSNELVAAIIGGLIATFGSVATIITSYLLRNVGKIVVNVNSHSIEKLKRDSGGGEHLVDSLTEADRVEYRFDVDFFNSSDLPKNLRAISVEFKSKKNKEIISLKTYVPRKVDYPVNRSYFIPNENLKLLNMSSKEIINLKLSGPIKKEEIKFLQGKVDFFFKGIYPNGKTFRKKLITQEF